jgi:hypothetical protein
MHGKLFEKIDQRAGTESVLKKLSTYTRNIPGPFAPFGKSLPSLNMTARLLNLNLIFLTFKH